VDTVAFLLQGFPPPPPAIIMLAAIYYGAMYGGSTTAILVNIPGEVAPVVTTIDQDGDPEVRSRRENGCGSTISMAMSEP
jgi:TctA family transporter